MTQSSITVTAAVCTYQRHERALAAVGSLLRQTLSPKRFKVLVVDNDRAEAGKLAEMLLDLGRGPVRVNCVTEPVLGVSHARNTALRACDSDVIAFLDDDALADPPWLECLLGVFETNANGIGAVGGKVVGDWSLPRPKWLPDSLLGYLSLIDWSPERIEVSPPLWLAGTNIAYSAQYLRSIGGFRTDLGRKGSLLISNEETEACSALRRKGQRVLYDPAAVVHHFIPAERLQQTWFRQRAFWQAVSDAFMYSNLQSAPEIPFRAIGRYGDALQDRSLEALFLGHENAELFGLQIEAIYQVALAFMRGTMSWKR